MNYVLIWPEISNMTKPYTTISFKESPGKTSWITEPVIEFGNF